MVVMTSVRILDLYSGMGGLSLGFALALKDAEILGFDIDPHAVITYNFNLSRFKARSEVQDVLRWDPEGDFDIIIGGSPCQPFSLANTTRTGKDHPYYPTFPKFFDIVLKLRPKAFLLENVKGLITRRHRSLLEGQLRGILPHYRVKYKVLNTAHYGVPQRRERLFILGIRKDLDATPSFPAPTHGEREQVTLTGRIYRWVTVIEAIGDLISSSPVIPQKPHPSRFRRVNSYDMPSWTVRRNSDRELILPVAQVVVIANRNDIREYSNTPSPTIMNIGAGGPRHGQPLVLDGNSYRRLTVREVLRLQSFPDWYKFPGNVPKTKMYGLLGEAVPPIMAYRLAVHIGKLLGLEVREPPRYEDWELPYFYRSFADYFGS